MITRAGLLSRVKERYLALAARLNGKSDYHTLRRFLAPLQVEGLRDPALISQLFQSAARLVNNRRTFSQGVALLTELYALIPEEKTNVEGILRRKLGKVAGVVDPAGDGNGLAATEVSQAQVAKMAAEVFGRDDLVAAHALHTLEAGDVEAAWPLIEPLSDSGQAAKAYRIIRAKAEDAGLVEVPKPVEEPAPSPEQSRGADPVPDPVPEPAQEPAEPQAVTPASSGSRATTGLISQVLAAIRKNDSRLNFGQNHTEIAGELVEELNKIKHPDLRAASEDEVAETVGYLLGDRKDDQLSAVILFADALRSCESLQSKLREVIVTALEDQTCNDQVKQLLSAQRIKIGHLANKAVIKRGRRSLFDLAPPAKNRDYHTYQRVADFFFVHLRSETVVRAMYQQLTVGHAEPASSASTWYHIIAIVHAEKQQLEKRMTEDDVLRLKAACLEKAVAADSENVFACFDLIGMYFSLGEEYKALALEATIVTYSDNLDLQVKYAAIKVNYLENKAKQLVAEQGRQTAASEVTTCCDQAVLECRRVEALLSGQEPLQRNLVGELAGAYRLLLNLHAYSFNFSGVHETAARLLELSPNNHNVYFARARVFILQGQLEEAEQVYREGIEVFTSGRVRDPMTLGLLYCNLAEVLTLGGRFDEARTFFGKAANKQAGDFLDVYYARARFLCSQDKLEEADLAISSATLTETKIPNDQLDDQEVKTVLAKRTLAKAEIARAKAIPSDREQALAQRPEIVKKYQQAIDVFQRDAAVPEREVEARGLLLRARLAFAEQDRVAGENPAEQLSLADAESEQLFADFPFNPNVRDIRAQVLELLGRPEEAAEVRSSGEPPAPPAPPAEPVLPTAPVDVVACATQDRARAAAAPATPPPAAEPPQPPVEPAPKPKADPALDKLRQSLAGLRKRKAFEKNYEKILYDLLDIAGGVEEASLKTAYDLILTTLGDLLGDSVRVRGAVLMLVSLWEMNRDSEEGQAELRTLVDRALHDPAKRAVVLELLQAEQNELGSSAQRAVAKSPKKGKKKADIAKPPLSDKVFARVQKVCDFFFVNFGELPAVRSLIVEISDLAYAVPARAVSCWHEAAAEKLSDDPKAKKRELAHWRLACKADPNNLTAKLELARSLVDHDNVGEIESLVLELLEADGHPALKFRAQVLLLLTVLYQARRDFVADRAGLVQESLERGQGIFNELEENYSGLEPAMQQIAAFSADMALACCHLASLHTLNGHYEEALELYNQVLAGDQVVNRAVHDCARLLVLTGNFIGALEVYKDATQALGLNAANLVDRTPGEEERWELRNSFLVAAAEIGAMMGNFETALSNAASVLQFDPDNPGAFLVQAWTNCFNPHPGAIQAAKEALATARKKIVLAERENGGRSQAANRNWATFIEAEITSRGKNAAKAWQLYETALAKQKEFPELLYRQAIMTWHQVTSMLKLVSILEELEGESGSVRQARREGRKMADKLLADFPTFPPAHSTILVPLLADKEYAAALERIRFIFTQTQALDLATFKQLLTLTREGDVQEEAGRLLAEWRGQVGNHLYQKYLGLLDETA